MVIRKVDLVRLNWREACAADGVYASKASPVEVDLTRRPGRDPEGRCLTGTANILCIVEPKTGRHLTHATTNRKRRFFAYALARIARAYPEAKHNHLVSDNLNTHGPRSLSIRPPAILPSHRLALNGAAGAAIAKAPRQRSAISLPAAPLAHPTTCCSSTGCRSPEH